MIYYWQYGCLYRARDDFLKQADFSEIVMSASRNAVRMAMEYGLSDFTSRAEFQVFVLFFRCRYQSVRDV